MTDRAIMEQSLKALEGSVDAVQREYDSDWRLLLPSRKAQLDGMKERLDAHKSTIAALRARLAQQALEPELVGVVHHKSTSLIGVDCEQIAVFIRPVEKGTKLYTISPQRAEQPAPQPEQDVPEASCGNMEQWDVIPDAFNEWWDADYDDTGNPFRKDSPAYWAWSGWKAASKQPEQEPVAWLDGPHLVVRLDMRNRLNYQGPWVDLGRAIPDKWTPFLYTAPPQRKEQA